MSVELLTPGQSLEKDMETGEDGGVAVHPYEISLEAGHFVRVAAEQLGFDVAVLLYDPAGELIVRVDSPTGRQGTETVVAVAEAAGTYRLEIHSAENGAPPGRYRLTLEEPRFADARHRRWAAAERLFSQAEGLRREGAKESLGAAVERYRETLALWQGLGDRRREAATRYRIGWVLLDRKEYAAAREPLELALAIYREIEARHGEALTLNRLGGLEIGLHDYDQALLRSQQVLELAPQIDDYALIAGCLNNLGLSHRRLGNVDEALAAYLEAKRLYEDAKEHDNVALTQTNLGNLFILQGKLREAADYLEAAVGNWTRLGQTRRAANTLTRLGKVRRQQGDLEKALKHLQNALALRRKSGNTSGEAATLNALGTVHLLRKEPDQARAAYAKALEIFKEAANKREEAVVLVNLGRLESVQGRPTEALARHRKAASLIARAGDRSTRASNLYGMARAHHDLNDYQSARDCLDETIDRVEDLRAETAGEGLRIAFFATRQHYYDLYVDVLMHLGETAAAFEMAERRRSRALIDLLGESADDLRQHADAGLLSRERAAQDALNELDARRSRALRHGDSLDEIERRQREQRLELDRARAEIRKSNPRYGELTRPRHRTVEEVQRYLLGPGSALLAYSFGDERGFLWTVTQNEIRGHVLPVTRKQIEQDALSAHHSLKERSSISDMRLEPTLARLSETLLAPAAELLGGERRTLLVVADGALLYLPFGALPMPGSDDGERLVQKHEIVHGPSASVLLTLREETSRRQPAPRLLALFADPKFKDDEWPALPATREEAAGILAVADGEIMTAFGDDASKESILRGDLRPYQILHLATHGVLRRDQPELSGLVLAANELLAVHEIYNLSLPAEMAVLSACSTGSGDMVRGEGFLGLTRAFMYAGTPRLVVSLWDVDDQATAELMKRFYWSLLITDAPPAMALRAAQLSMLSEERWQHPYYWGGFVFQGDWRRPGRQDRDDKPIEGHDTGAAEDDEADTDYPGPGNCEHLPEPWMRDLCHLLAKLARKGSRG